MVSSSKKNGSLGVQRSICLLFTFISFLMVLSEKLLQSVKSLYVFQVPQLETIALVSFSVAWCHSFHAESNYLYSEGNFICTLWSHFCSLLGDDKDYVNSKNWHLLNFVLSFGFKVFNMCYLINTQKNAVRYLSLSPFYTWGNWDHLEIKWSKVTLSGRARI